MQKRFSTLRLEAKPSLDACREVTGKRCMVISRSTFPGTAKYAQHWLGDNYSIWRHLKQSVIGKVETIKTTRD